jgi:hypothetical protein
MQYISTAETSDATGTGVREQSQSCLWKRGEWPEGGGVVCEGGMVPTRVHGAGVPTRACSLRAWNARRISSLTSSEES